MKVYALRHKKTGEYSKGGRYAESTTERPLKLWHSYEEFISFLKYYARDTLKWKEGAFKAHEEEVKQNKKRKKPYKIDTYRLKQWEGWKIGDILKDFELITFELEESGKNSTIRKIVNGLVKEGKIKEG